ncbi:MAG: hypothetical protein ACI837_001221 [Crocinitomicaceae bacterium]|jgi:hypothetical protein
MKKFLALSVMTLCSYITFSQNYYQVKVLGVDYTQIQIDQAFASADFCGSHKYSERRELTFNDGTVIELLGSTELATIDSSCSQPNDFIFSDAVWSISGSHLIMAQDSNAKLSVKEKINLKPSKQ